MMKLIIVFAAILGFIFIPALYSMEQGKDLQEGEQEQVSEQQEETQVSEDQAIKATPEQQRRVRECIKSTQHIRNLCNGVERLMKRSRMLGDPFRRKIEQVMNETVMMQNDHEKFLDSLSEDQEKHFESRIESMDKINEKINGILEKMNEQLEKRKMQRSIIASHTEDIGFAMDDWQGHYRNIAVDMSIDILGK